MATSTQVQRLPTPLSSARVETGAVQFGDDWPGLFIRGDDAHSLAFRIRQLSGLLAGHSDSTVADALQHLMTYADLVEQDVVLRQTT